MSIEAMKLALDALEHASSLVDGYYIPQGKTTLPEVEAATAALREAIRAAESEAALEKMADNARELGLGYESAEPLTDEQIVELLKPLYRDDALTQMALGMEIATVRAVERAHGIGGRK